MLDGETSPPDRGQQDLPSTPIAGTLIGHVRIIVKSGHHRRLYRRGHHHPGMFANGEQFGDDGQLLAHANLAGLDLAGEVPISEQQCGTRAEQRENNDRNCRAASRNPNDAEKPAAHEPGDPSQDLLNAETVEIITPTGAPKSSPK